MRRLISLICAGWLPHDLNPPRSASFSKRACGFFRSSAQRKREGSLYRFSLSLIDFTLRALSLVVEAFELLFANQFLC
jgi:hypothetical protein